MTTKMLLWKRHTLAVEKKIIIHEIQSLLWSRRKGKKNSRVSIKPSNIPGAGLGIYAVSKILPGQVACLYPGVFTPPLPFPADVEARYHYLADQFTPSGFPASENAYLLNLKEVGGYLDGLAVNPSFVNDPSMSGHLINHNPSNRNVQVISFAWSDILTETDGNPKGASSRFDATDIPNQRRVDGSPWYFDSEEDQIVYFENSPIEKLKVCGAAMIVERTVEKDEELFLDYGLKDPLPDWAREWYQD